MLEKSKREKRRENTDVESDLSGYVEQNKEKLERVSLYSDIVTSAMAVALLQKGNSGGE